MKGSCLIFILALLVSGCSKISSQDVDPQAIYGNINVQRASSGSVDVDCTFYVGGPTGTIVTIDSPASVDIDGSPANVTNDPILNITSYTANLSPSLPSIGVVYTDKNGNAYNNSFPMPGDLWNTGIPGTISMSGGFSLTLNTDNPFAQGENITVILEASNGSSVYPTSVQANMTSAVVSVPGNFYRSMATGSAQIQTCRTSYPNPQAPYPQGLSITAGTCTGWSAVTLVP